MTVVATKQDHKMLIQKYDIRRPNNDEFEERYWSPINTPVLNGNGMISFIIHTVVDVTELIQLQRLEQFARHQAQWSKETLSSFFAQAPMAVAIFSGASHVVQFANQPFLNIWKRGLDEVIQRPCFELYLAHTTLPVERILKEVYTTGVPASINEHQSITIENGKPTKKYYSVVYQPIRDAQAEVTGVIVAANDVTEIIVSRNKARESAQKMIYTNQELEQLAYSASHDLQEPLRKIKLFADMVAVKDGKNLSQGSAENLKKIYNTAEKMSKLIQSLMVYAWHSREVDKVRTNLSEIANEFRSSMVQDLSEAAIQFSVDDLPEVVADPVQMRQLFGNIISNSIKFAKRDGPLRIRISYNKIPSGSLSNKELNPDVDYYELKFTDNGIGFEPEYAQQIFLPFKRLHPHNKYEGYGVGLAICKKIVMNHKGTIEARSMPGHGTTILVTLPG